MTTPLLHVWLIRQVLWASLVFASSVSSVTVTKTTTTASSSTVSTPTLSTAASIARAPSASYGGGPVISNVEATIIFYNSTSTDQKDLKDYYNFLVQSPLVDALQEYSTPTQTIGRGHVVGSYFENKNLKQTLDNLADIRPYLRNLTIAGIISPNDNSYYPIHFASGIQITDSSGQSCVTFGGYHSATYVADIANVTYLYYAVLPNCGQRALDMAPAISHELAEAITDPLYPRGWNSAALSAEIGDICAGFYTQLSDAKGKLWYVQNIWSNMQKKCGATPLHAPSSTVTTSTTTTRVSTQTWIPFTSNGMIMPNIQVTPVLYGEVNFRSHISGLYLFLVGQFMDMLSEYSVGATIVGRGQVLAAVSLNADGALSLNDPIDIMQLFRYAIHARNLPLFKRTIQGLGQSKYHPAK
ncbi:hypothetical protein BC830DRAFT_669451 [Chytriomyces sp. MP71]|nr:hypothetical protein BC830DRAFT_669451 [Chytriomyces sp. MP71]